MDTAYSAERAAALAGIPLSTLHYWARTELLVPSVSATRVKLWSYQDILGLRTIDWLRRDKPMTDDTSIPRSRMRAIRTALNRLDELDLGSWTDEGQPRIVVDRDGSILIERDHLLTDLEGQLLLKEALDLIAPFGEGEAGWGPDLRCPRPHLRIVPGKLAGEPHVESTRVETQALAALARRGYSAAEIAELYPFLARVAVDEALDLEEQLASNERQAA
mgnify:CR=1 FL=1